MMLKRLTVEQYRGFTARTEFTFDPNLTLIVGENGVGKTSVLWALRVLLSHSVARMANGKSKSLLFQADDIAKGWPFLRAEVDAIHGENDTRLTCSAQKNSTPFVKGADDDGRPREHAVDTPDKYDVTGISESSPRKRKDVSPPLSVYYSAHRSLALNRGPSKARAGGGVRAAFAEALDDRELRLGEAALLWRKEDALERSDGRPARANRAVEQALPNFLGEFHHLRVEGEQSPRLVVDKRGTTLDLSQLSDGERGTLAILIDLTRRLSQANPALDEPAREGRAVVLIDELELHMHPRWQREIVSHITTTFPKCQFIATTHSPTIVGEAQPDTLLLLRQQGDRIVPERRGQAYGLDANYVLEHIMGTASRATPATEAIHSIENALDTGDLKAARTRLETLRALLHGDDPVLVGLEATINNLEALGHASDSEEK